LRIDAHCHLFNGHDLPIYGLLKSVFLEQNVFGVFAIPFAPARTLRRVVLLGHARILVAELRGDHAQGHATHGEQRGMSVPQNVKRWGRAELGPVRSFGEGPLLVRSTPRIVVGA
jgi:hypothetical protein